MRKFLNEDCGTIVINDTFYYVSFDTDPDRKLLTWLHLCKDENKIRAALSNDGIKQFILENGNFPSKKYKFFQNGLKAYFIGVDNRSRYVQIENKLDSYVMLPAYSTPGKLNEKIWLKGIFSTIQEKAEIEFYEAVGEWPDRLIVANEDNPHSIEIECRSEKLNNHIIIPEEVK